MSYFPQPVPGGPGKVAAVVAMASALGLAAALWKRAHQFSYGVFEILSAALAAGVAARQFWSSPPRWFELTVGTVGAIYLTQRGIQNCIDAKRSREGHSK